MTKVYLEPEQIIILENETTNLRDRLLIRILFHVGCRVSEAIALKIEDIDLTQGTITIKHLKRRLRLSCPSCEARLGASYSYCPKCGQKLGEIISQKLEHRR